MKVTFFTTHMCSKLFTRGGKEVLPTSYYSQPNAFLYVLETLPTRSVKFDASAKMLASFPGKGGEKTHVGRQDVKWFPCTSGK